MLSLITVSMALAFSAPDDTLQDEIQKQPVQSEQTVDMSKRLSSAELARLRSGGGVPDYCEVYWRTNPVTGVQQCDLVVCRPPGSVWSLHECFEFGLD